MEITVLLLIALMLFAFGAINIKAKSNIFGIILGLMMIVAGLFGFFDGIEYKTGYTAQPEGTFGVNETLNVTYTYQNLEDTKPNLHKAITAPLMIVGIYVMFNSALNLFKNQKD